MHSVGTSSSIENGSPQGFVHFPKLNYDTTLLETSINTQRQLMMDYDLYNGMRTNRTSVPVVNLSSHGQLQLGMKVDINCN